MGWLSRQSKGQSLQTTIRSAINPWSRATLKCQPSKETLWCKKPDLESRRDAICNKKDQRTDAKIQLMNNCLHAYDKSVPHIQAHKGLQSVFNVHLDSKTLSQHTKTFELFMKFFPSPKVCTNCLLIFGHMMDAALCPIKKPQKCYQLSKDWVSCLWMKGYKASQAHTKNSLCPQTVMPTLAVL